MRGDMAVFIVDRYRHDAVNAHPQKLGTTRCGRYETSAMTFPVYMASFIIDMQDEVAGRALPFVHLVRGLEHCLVEGDIYLPED